MRYFAIILPLLFASSFVSAECSTRTPGVVSDRNILPNDASGNCFGWDASLTRGLKYDGYVTPNWSKKGNKPHGIQLDDSSKVANTIDSNLESNVGNVVTKTTVQ